MCDLWKEIVAGSNVWLISRELYSSLCICASNRSPFDTIVKVDTSGCKEVSVLCEWSDGKACCALEPGRTRIVAVLTPTTQDSEIVFEASCEMSTSSLPEEHGSKAIDDSVQLSNKIELWLQQRH